jgi:hypothetical protein
MINKINPRTLSIKNMRLEKQLSGKRRQLQLVNSMLNSTEMASRKNRMASPQVSISKTITITKIW